MADRKYDIVITTHEEKCDIAIDCNFQKLHRPVIIKVNFDDSYNHLPCRYVDIRCGNYTAMSMILDSNIAIVPKNIFSPGSEIYMGVDAFNPSRTERITSYMVQCGTA